MYTQYDYKQGYQKSRYSKTAFDKIPTDIGTNTTTGIGEFMMFIEEFSIFRSFYKTLVSCTCGKKRDKCINHESCNKNKYQTNDTLEYLVLQEVSATAKPRCI
jgi:hypothetical protein